jgi:hypothetical protein
VPPAVAIVIDVALIVEAVIAWSKVSDTLPSGLRLPPPSLGDVLTTVGGCGETVVNVHDTVAGSAVSSSERIPVVSLAV